MSDRLYSFVGGISGEWAVSRIDAVIGAPLPPVRRLAVHEGEPADTTDMAWVLRGVTGHDRYITRGEKSQLAALQQPPGRADSTCAALIPIRKNAEWWALTQDERREIFEETSHHVAVGLEYLPPIARRLHHSRDLGEPFDFLTWFEYAPRDAASFEDLVGRLRETPEWGYVEREVDIRLARG